MVRTKITYAVLFAGVVSGCRGGPSAEELARLRDEVRAEDARLRARDDAGAQTWTLNLRTSTPGVRRTFTLAELVGRARTEIRTVGPSSGTDYTTPHRFRGVRLAELVDGADPGPGGEVTLIGADGYYTALRWEDVQRYPILVAVERDGAPIARADGGPVLAALPLSLEADLAARYGEDGFCFYLTGIGVGRPRPRIDVDGMVREPEDLVRPGLVRRKQRVRFRRGWPASSELEIAGVRLSDVVGTKTSPVRVASFGRPPHDAVVMTPEELESCDPLLVVGPTPTTAPIPLGIGGPVLLAPLPTCTAAWAASPWPALVDGVEVVR